MPKLHKQRVGHSGRSGNGGALINSKRQLVNLRPVAACVYLHFGEQRLDYLTITGKFNSLVSARITHIEKWFGWAVIVLLAALTTVVGSSTH